MSELFRVISLDRTPQRFAQFLAWNPGLPVERFPACDGAQLSAQGCIAEGLITAANKYVPGALGLARSHVALWRQCASGTVPFHIAEDDIILRADFWAAAKGALNALPAWDIVLWTHNLDWPVKFLPGAGLGPAFVQHTPDVMDIAAFRSATGPSVLLPLVSAAGTGCYSISPSGAARMLASCLPIGDAPAEFAAKPGVRWTNTGLDVEMSRHYAGQRAFLAMPPLALAPNDQANSTIRGSLSAPPTPKPG
jgi:GR25 family glycosyltransferase involved in LPS biosynthesis